MSPLPESATIRGMNEQLISDNIPKLRQRVRRSAEKSEFGNSDILVIAVSKTRPAEDIRVAHAHGLVNFGENYLQEAVQKITALQDLPLIWHFIGPIQSNKTSLIAEHFDWVHTIDREKIARRLNDQRPTNLPPLQVCVQINISGESSKSGASMKELPNLAQTILQLPRLQLRGLMAIPAANAGTAQQHEVFSLMREALAQLRPLAPAVDTLSMGMSDDLEAAILEGASAIRVGTAIFGPRNR
jgi:pyridoxal phosphate enzyme (YggS family)